MPDVAGENAMAQDRNKDRSKDRRTVRALAALLPAGTLGLSATLADANATASAGPGAKKPVAERLQTIRDTVSGALNEMPLQDGDPFLKVDPEKRLAWWGNGGWRNGGWHNGWHNGGWHNGWGNGGWHNGWGNGLNLNLNLNPWNNWGNGWHNGWHNW